MTDPTRTLADSIDSRANGASAPGRLLDVRSLNVSTTSAYHPRTLVHDISFGMNAGESLAIVGESGSGKSLTAKAILGLLPAGLVATGRAALGDAELLSAPEKRLRELRGSRACLLLQDPFTMLNPLQSAGAHIRESLRGTARRRRGEAAAEVTRRLAEVGLDADVAQRYPFELSGGMRQRVALAAALAGDPDLLIADEPTTALDMTTQADVLDLLRTIRAQRDMALIFVTHDLQVAFSISDRILVMYAGSVLEYATPEALTSTPGHPYTVALLGAEPPSTFYTETLESVPGRMPSADAVAGRCGFADRCAWRVEACVLGQPPLAPVGPAHRSACVRAPVIADELLVRLRRQHRPGVPPPPTGGDRVATLTEVTKSYAASRLVARSSKPAALRSVSLDVGVGESVGLVGESGSGKTTVARLLLGLATAQTGAIGVGDLVLDQRRRMARDDRRRLSRLVQAVFQDPYSSLNPAFTIERSIREAMRAGGEEHGSVGELLELVGLPASYASRRPASLSGGERQRAAIARAIAVRPALLVCDEPVAALDVSVQAQVLEVLRTVRREYRMSMLFISHDLAVVRQMTERIFVLHRGRIVESGVTAAVLDQPTDEYTRRLAQARAVQPWPNS